ncbi:MAG: universal stress protein [Cytophagales bacterium]|nr:universal stress protein [Rhizobacter sp.]
MTYRSILVHLDESPRCQARISLAASLARAQGSHLLGLAPTGLVNLPPALRPTLVGGADLAAAARLQMKQRAADLVSGFNHQVATLGLVSHEGRVHDDDSLSAVLQHAHASDLVVLGQNDPKHFTPLVSWDFPQQVFLHAGRPVLVLPYAGDFKTVGQQVLVAWVDSRESARALADALPLLQQARQVDVLSLTHRGETATATSDSLAGVGQWLARHGVKVRLHSELTELDVGNALLSRASDLGSDLLVMGGYGHARVTEMVMGGATRSVLSQMTVPVLISH